MTELRGRVHGRPDFPVRAEVESFSLAQRRKRALRLALPLVLLSLVVLPVPGLHLTAPLLLGSAFLFGRRRLREAERILRLVGDCPCDAGAQAYELPERVVLPLILRCPGCREFVKVERA